MTNYDIALSNTLPAVYLVKFLISVLQFSHRPNSILFTSTGVTKYRIGREEDKDNKVRLMGARLNKGIFNMGNTEQVK